MKERNKEIPVIEKLTLAEARARIHEFKGLKMIEGRSGGAAVSAGHPSRSVRDEKGSVPKGKS